MKERETHQLLPHFLVLSLCRSQVLLESLLIRFRRLLLVVLRLGLRIRTPGSGGGRGCDDVGHRDLSHTKKIISIQYIL